MDCPSCERTLSTEAGLRQHHTKVHDRPLPNRTCSGCGAAFYDQKSRLEYCDDCDPNAGSNNGNWDGGLSTATCAECGSEFEYYSSEKDGVYCPTCVKDCDGLLPENPMEPIERVVTECPACGEEQLVLQSLLERRERGVFCDLDCYGDWLSENVVGPDHHQWTGSDPVYAHGWSAVRRAARVRDEHRCQLCGATKSEIGRNPDVHHIQPVRSFDHPKEAHSLDNVISLCRSCHRRVEGGAVSVPSPRNG